LAKGPRLESLVYPTQRGNCRVGMKDEKRGKIRENSRNPKQTTGTNPTQRQWKRRNLGHQKEQLVFGDQG